MDLLPQAHRVVLQQGLYMLSRVSISLSHDNRRTYLPATQSANLPYPIDVGNIVQALPVSITKDGALHMRGFEFPTLDENLTGR